MAACSDCVVGIFSSAGCLRVSSEVMVFLGEVVLGQSSERGWWEEVMVDFWEVSVDILTSCSRLIRRVVFGCNAALMPVATQVFTDAGNRLVLLFCFGCAQVVT